MPSCKKKCAPRQGDGQTAGESDQGSNQPAKALYVHVPFCLAKCRYCDFFSVRMDEHQARSFVQAALKELQASAHHLRTPLESLFIGGGTPTCLGPALLAELLEPLAGLTDGRTEFSVEANPGTINSEVAAVLAGCGVNRVSLGAQSFDDGELQLLGRIHRAEDIGQAVAALRRHHLDNISLDLIYGIPTQTTDSWQDSLRAALGLEIRHLSCYALSYEPRTPLERDLAVGKIAQMEESAQRDCYYLAIDQAAAAGLEHYEISNFAAPGRRCRHNITYWRNETYLGIGPAAASYLAGVRRTNLPDLAGYVSAVGSGRSAPCESEALDARHRMAETLMLGLRLIEGVIRQRFQDRFGVDPVEAFGQSIGRYAALGALAIEPSRIRLTRGALFVADTVLADIIAEA